MTDIPMPPVSYTIKDFCAVTGLGKTTVYERIKTGEIKAITLFGRRLIPATEAKRLIEAASH
ncbi:helix-turn-helix domain-containing protein [Asticcacaulis machinosus]|uniref:Helix-turn-helix domain-containing protein n=1 Tax=Asticcacaulis machinosus TaxID=2984211 RepID=A0ABT5HII2_9CAUL|nr:helix-turn-helix domain-containing protein [Asticcacaulis machinosus]MDC7675414.1 helix-turn-helix domain-containing protein [Asticcacaulis machinosus]